MDSGLEDITEAELLQAVLDDRMTNVHVAVPARVESYDSSKQTVDVTPQLNYSLPDGDGNYVTRQRPRLADVPVKFQRCKKFAMTFPLEAGDFGLLVFCERNIGAWRQSASQGDPGDLGMHTMDGAVFIPGLYPDQNPAQTADGTNMVIGSDTDGNSRIEIKPSGGINLGAGASDGVATKTDLGALYNAISNAAVVAMDGGASFKAAILTALGLAGWSASVGVTQFTSSKIKAVR